MRIRGLVKQLDRQGRIIIPREMLEALDMEVGAPVEILGGLDPDGMPALVIRKYHKGCAVCGVAVRAGLERKVEWRGDTQGLVIFGDKRICNGCLSEINSQMFSQKK